jgi:homopolymeric O-antigen transport system permease protein
MDASAQTLRIDAEPRWSSPLSELWAYRELVGFLIWRDLKVRYKQTVLGVLWAVIQPVMTMVLFSIVFGQVAKLPSDGIPYPLFTFAALLPWQLFAGGITGASNSLIGSSGLLTKVYFPRLVIPVAAVTGALVDFAIAFCILLGMMVWYGATPPVAVLLLPLFVLLALVTAFAAGLWLSALNVKYRDVRYAMPFLMQFWLLASPVAYSASLVPAKWQFLYGLNPLVTTVQGFRWAIVGATAPSMFLLPSIVSALVMLISGLVYFRRMEDTFADVV